MGKHMFQMSFYQQISNAYSVLGDKAKRKDYDQSLKPKKSIYTHQRYIAFTPKHLLLQSV